MGLRLGRGKRAALRLPALSRGEGFAVGRILADCPARIALKNGAVSDESTLSLLKLLTEAHGASGSEQAVRDVFFDQLQPFGGAGAAGAAGLSFSCDRLGSVMAERPGTIQDGPRVMITAHMDEVGFAIQSINEKGFLQLVALGGWWTHTLVGQRLRFLNRRGEEVMGVVTSTPPHFLPESERSKVLALEQLYVDIGARSRGAVGLWAGFGRSRSAGWRLPAAGPRWSLCGEGI
jgi:M42 glutamyl aminopeptidase